MIIKFLRKGLIKIITKNLKFFLYPITILPYAAILHLCVGIYMYGQPLIFPTSQNEINTAVSSNLEGTGYTSYLPPNSEDTSIYKRTYSNALLFVLILLILAFSVF